MSQNSSHEQTEVNNAECLEVIREEQCSLKVSSFNIDATSKIITKNNTYKDPCGDCTYKETLNSLNGKINTENLEKLIDQKEQQLRAEFQRHLKKEMNSLKEKFDYILQNEQIRSSYMLREAYRERQEKIKALQTQLECKNFAGLMFVMCSERRKSKLEKLSLIEEYTNYIRALQEILKEGQSLILNLSRGYKTAARVDHEWREKMKKIVNEFQSYVYHYGGKTPESNQYFFDLPHLLETKTPVIDNSDEDPCTYEDEDQSNNTDKVIEPHDNKTWWGRLDDDCRPFVMFGDMADFQPPRRREVLRAVKATKTAPKKWKEYAFNDMYVMASCPNADVIKDDYVKRLSEAGKWECQAVQTQERVSNTSITTRRMTSVDIRGNMGSILKIITSNVTEPVTKATLLGARDSMEIASTTKLTSMIESCDNEPSEEVAKTDPELKKVNSTDEEEEDESLSALGSIHNDSLQVIGSHVPDRDHKINYEKVCPMEKCQRMQVDSFIRTLPPYMRANPFTYFEQTYDDYEVCTPEQLEILRQRISEKKTKEKEVSILDEYPLAEWTPSVEGVAIQTSNISMSLPPCTCRTPSPTPASSTSAIFRLENLISVKQELDNIKKECFYDSGIEFNRFQVIGQGNNTVTTKTKEDFSKSRLQSIKKILKKHPSLCDIFQANTLC
ncbi:uncharacterized protein LOC113514484 [Galleria mellonella]|uniref:Uncharacterized protein LOC113514484 n=1 Tax=Galleria mellonella TaxID=7137 RepID=A0ABM3MJ88_GALME|nr:uncharacterized protein LOC113514484 [Galleria mellonella]